MSFLKSAILQATPPQEGAVPSLAPTTEKEFRQFADAPVMREWVYNNALEAASNLPSLQNPRYSLELDNVDYVDPGKFTYRDEKDAILRGKTLSRRLRGTWVLRDAMKNVLQRRRQTLAHIPHVTDRGTFIHNGNEYTISNQQRLRPGIFTRVKDNGEIEAHVNILPGEGVAHRYFLDPAKGAFYIRIRQAKIPLMTLARALGATDAQLREAWGPELLAANYRYDQPAALKKLYERLKPRGGGPPPKDLGEMREQLAGILASMRLDPEVTRQTLGKPYDRLSLDVILDTTKKLLAVSRGEADVDDRDHLAFQTFLGPEDLIAERLRKDYGGVRRKLLSKATFKGNLDMIPTNALNRQVEAALLHSGLGQALEEINPSDVFDKQWRLSRMGEGGIPTLDAIPDESRSLQPSHLSYVDPLRTPESYKTGVDLFLARKTRKGKDGKLYAPFINAKTGKTVYKSPQDIADLAIAFPGEMEQPGKRVAAMYRGKLRFVPRDEISFIVPQFEDTMSPLGNLIPLKSMVKGQRAVMAARMLTQALPLTEREAPWVQSAIPGGEGKSFEDEYGKHMGAIRAVAGGVVRAVEPGRIVLQTAEGEREIELYDSFPYNRKTYLHQTSVVRPGDQVRPGDLLATSNYTDSKGVTALGRNARVAYIPFRGLNFEDAIVISQSFADKMVSEHMYQQRLDWTEDHRRGRRDYISLFPGSFDRRQLDTITENGLAKPGTVLQYDDPVILAATVRAPSHHKIFRRKTPSFADATVRWNHHSPGMVTDVVDDEKGSTVLVKSLSPMQVGDKLSGRYSGKGIVSCYDDKTCVMTNRGWVLFADLQSEDRIASKVGDEWVFVQPQKRIVHPYTGKLFVCRHERLNYAVTPNHRMWCRIEHYRGKKAQYRIRSAEDTYGKRVYHCAALPMRSAGGLGTITLPQTRRNPGKPAPASFDGRTFCAFLGWWLSEGSKSQWIGTDIGKTKAKVTNYKIQIAQSRRENLEKCQTIESVLDAMRVGWRYSGCQYIFSNKAIWSYLQDQGLCHEKHVPRKILDNANLAELRVLLDALLAGDGSFRNATSNQFTTTSPYLADGVQELCARLGLASSRVNRPPSANGRYPHYVVTVFYDRSEVGSGADGSYAKIDYRGNVYCVDVGGEGVILVRREGKPFWCGNSIVPDEQMPHDMENRPFEILLNPLGVISRGNPAQIVEAALGKIAAKTGEAYKLEDWDGRDMAAFALKELRRHGMSDLESIIDPGTERKIPDVFVGNRWFMKLHHTAESKSQARGIGSYTQEETPARGGETGAKRLSLLNTNALLSHGTTAVLRDASLIRGQRNEDYWLAFMKGYDPPDPKVPAVYEKFVNQLRSAGINVISDGGQLQVMAMTDADVDQLAGNREITSGETVRFEKELEPVPGGLFDPKLTGGHRGGRWSFVRLHEPLPSPVFEEPIRKLLGLTQKRLREILAGRERIGDFTGPGAVSKALDDINVPKEIARARADIRSGRRTARDNAVRKLGYLKACQRLGIHPREWMLSKVPVLPPQFRPISVIEEGQIPLVADANFLYKELIDANNNLRRMSGEVSDVGDERLALYDTFRAVIGLGDPIHPRLQQKRVRGVLSHIFGSSPKLSVVQRRLIGSSVDVVGRAVIAPNPDFDMDTVGLPENQAWDVYKMFIVRRLHRRGLPLLQAARHVKDRTSLAREEMLNEMAERPVFIDRAPVLHRFGIMAFWPRLVKGDVMQISPLVVGGFNADFDGDAMQYHVPVDEAAKQEAIELMLPSKNLLSPRDFATPVYQPTQEYLGGLFAASSAPPKGKRAHYFANRKAAIAAYQRGEISVDTPVVVPT